MTAWENHKLRTSSKYQEWRLKVLKRDNYTCGICKSITKSLQVHHKTNFSTDIENRYNIDNGITLCLECHKKLHHTEGYKR